MLSEFGEVGLTTFELCTLFVSEVIGEEAALGFDHEVEAFGAVFVHQHSPIGIVMAKRSGDAKPTGELGVNLDGFVFFQLLGKGAFGVGLIDNLFVGRLVRVDHRLEVAGQLFGLE